MRKCSHSARAYAARGLAAGLFAAIALSGSTAWAQQKDIKWGTGPVGASGHKALVVLANLLNKEMPEYRITVLPTPGAVTTVKGFATGEFDGYYGSDVALKEFATDSGRFKGFKGNAKRLPIQSLWTYTLDVGLAIKASNRDKIKTWSDLTGKRVFTGPLPFDTRKHLENAMADIGIKHKYVQVDIDTAGSQLESGALDAIIIYAAAGKSPPPWIAQASLTVDWAALNPSADELAKLKAKGYAIAAVDPSNFKKKTAHVEKVTLLPFFWGFDVGLNIPPNDLYKMLTIIEKHADELGKLDPSFEQIAGGKMAEFQKRALEGTWNLVPIHPGLARFLKERGMWDKKWDANVAAS